MFSSHKFYNLTTSFCTRGKCFGVSSDVEATNAANERIAENTNNSNAEINRQTNETNLQIQRETNAANIQMNEENNRLQQKLQDEMNAFNYRMWQENNEYNSPLQQLERAKDAGINPNSALGNAVASTPVQQVSLPQTTPGHADAAQVQPFEYQGYTAIPARKDELELMSEFANQLNSSADTMGKVLANQNQSYVNDFAPAMLAAGLQGSRLKNDLTKSDIKNVNQNTLLMARQAEGITQQIAESRQKVFNLQMEWNNLSEDNYRKQIDNSFAFAMNEANLNNISADTGLKSSNIRYLGVKMKCESMLAYAQANHLNYQNEVLKVEAKAKQQFLDEGGTIAQIRQMNSAADLYCSNKTGQDLQNGITEQIGQYQVREAAANADNAEYQNSTFVRSLDALDKISGSVQKVGTGVGSVVNAFKPGVSIETNHGYISTPTGRNPYE